jgi:cell division protein FtsQ
VARAEAAVLPWRVRLPQVHPRAWLGRVAPTRRSLVVGLAILGCASLAYVIARETSVFAINQIEVRGGSARLDAQVRQALAPVVGKPLVGLDGAAVVTRVEALSTVVSASYDRAFPHTLRVAIVPERPVAVLRSGSDSWLVSFRGRVMQRLASGADPALPRVWITGHTAVRIGAQLAGSAARIAISSVGLAGTFASRIATASYADGGLVFHLRSGLQVLLGPPGDVKLKVAVAVRALSFLPSGSSFLDVSVPGRTVSGTGSPAIAVPQSSSRG